MVFMARSHTVCGMYLYPYHHSYQAFPIFGKSQSKFGFNSSEDRRGHCIASNMIIRPGKMKMGEIKYLPCSVYLDCWRLATPLVVSLCEPLGLSCWVEIISATQCPFYKRKNLDPPKSTYRSLWTTSYVKSVRPNCAALIFRATPPFQNARHPSSLMTIYKMCNRKWSEKMICK